MTHGAPPRSGGPTKRMRVFPRRMADHYLEPVPHDTIKRSTITGGSVVLASQATKFAIAMITVAIMARILTPSDYGLFALLLIIVNFFAVLNNFGLSSATVQRTSLTSHEASAMFWVSSIFGLGLALLCVAISPALGMALGHPSLVPAICVISAGFVFSGVGMQHRALLTRVMNFRAVAASDVAAQLLSAGIGITLAVLGAGVWSLVLLQVSYAGLFALFLALASGWNPGWPRRPLLVGDLVHFGARVTGFEMATFFGKNSDNFLLGVFKGTSQVGNYSRAYNLLVAPLEQVMYPLESVMVASLSRIGADATEAYRRTFTSVASKLNLLLVPMIAFAVVDAHAIIRVVLGDQWDGAARVFEVLGVGGLVEPLIVMTSWLFVSQGRTRDYLLLGLVSVPVMVLGFVIGLPYGMVGVATAYTVVTCAGVVPTLWFVGREGPVAARDLYRSCALGAVVGLAVAIGAVIGREAVGTADALVSLLVSGALGAAAGCLAIALLPSARGQVRETAELGLEMVRRRSVGPAA
jgi:polysaccharide transporter, PST family